MTATGTHHPLPHYFITHRLITSSPTASLLHHPSPEGSVKLELKLHSNRCSCRLPISRGWSYLLQSFNLLVKVPGLPEDSSSLKIRMLPGLLICECCALNVCSCHYWQHCEQCIAPIFRFLRGRFWGFFALQGVAPAIDILTDWFISVRQVLRSLVILHRLVNPPRQMLPQSVQGLRYGPQNWKSY